MANTKTNRREFLKATGAATASALLVRQAAAEEESHVMKTSLSDDRPKGRSLRAIEQSEHRENNFNVFERIFSSHDEYPSIGLANIHAVVPGIEANKEKILQCLEVFKQRRVNVAIFPEFCLTGYFWEDERACRKYMDQGVIENHLDWIEKGVKPMFDDHLKAVVLNNIRRGPEGDYYNSTFVITPTHDHTDEKDIYDKVFLPGIEKVFTKTGLQDRLVLETRFGRLGFTTCYDYLFSELIQEYAKIDRVDAIIQLASWRGSAIRDYPGMNVGTDTYYGELWDMVMPSTSAINQVWTVACNAVGVHGISGAVFWGGSGIWAPSGMCMIQGSRTDEQLLVVHNVDVKGQRALELDDFNYAVDFEQIYRRVDGKRIFTRIRD